jgi:hypothetical protein
MSSVIARPALRSTVAIGAVIGALDAIFAIAINVFVLRVCTTAQLFQYIASGLLGRASFAGGASTVALRVVLHFAIAYVWTALFIVAARVSPALRDLISGMRGAILAGLPYGASIWLVMDLVVLPLAHVRPTPVASSMFLIMLLWHAAGLGVPLAMMVRRAYRRR